MCRNIDEETLLNGTLHSARVIGEIHVGFEMERLGMNCEKEQNVQIFSPSASRMSSRDILPSVKFIGVNENMIKELKQS